MKFLVDAQLPRALAEFLRVNGFDVIHTDELPAGNDTTDTEINRLSITEKRTVISKDADFYNRFTAIKEPFKLLHVKTGNITNAQLLELFEKNLTLIVSHFEQNSVVQITRNRIIKIL